MKQTVQEAAREICEAWGMEDNHGYGVKDTFEVGFCQGAQWQAKQSPWISVEEQLPDTDNGQSLYEVLVKTCDGRYNVACNVSVEFLAEKGEVTHWMPIPEFNEK